MEVETVGNLKFGFGEGVPPEDACPSADGMSSDATVLCIDSDAEDEVQSQDDFNPDLERRLKEKGLQAGPEPLSQFKSFGQVPGLNPRGPVNDGKQYKQEDLQGKRRSEGLVGETEMSKIAHGGKRGGWSKQQEYEAKAVAAAMRTLEAKFKQQFVAGGQGSFCTPGWKVDDMRGQRRKKGNHNHNVGNLHGKKGVLYGPWEKKVVDDKSVEVAQVASPQHGQQQRSGKRRGRRGGRGRRNSEREAVDEVPKLEKSLEEELAEQMSNQAANESALAQSVSSLRLHVAGGGTMIILNDREITDGESPEDILNELDLTPRSTIVSAREEQTDEQTSSTSSKISSPESEVPRSRPVPRMMASSAKPPSRIGGSYQHGHPQRLHGSGPSLSHFRPNFRGCGAFFPPNLLAQVKGDARSAMGMHMRRSTVFEMGRPQQQAQHAQQVQQVQQQHGLQGPRLNARAVPFVPVTPAPSPQKASAPKPPPPQQQQQQHVRSASQGAGSTATGRLVPLRKNGTGCFIPMYVKQADEKSSVTSSKVHKASLAESLSSISDVDFSLKRSRLKLQAPPQLAVSPQTDKPVEKSSPARDSGPVSEFENAIVTKCLKEKNMSLGGMMMNKHVRSPTTPAEELLSLLDKEDEFTTFTSPLHLEETLEGLEAEQQALEETQEKMLDLEMENCGLKNTINSINKLTGEIDKLKCANTALQVMLFVALAKPENLKIEGGSSIPRGMFGAAGQLDRHELEAVQEKLSSKSAELFQIQKALEKKNSELQALRNTQLSELERTKKKEAVAVCPKTPRSGKEFTTTPPVSSRTASTGKVVEPTPRKALSARVAISSKSASSASTVAKPPVSSTRKACTKSTVTKRTGEKTAGIPRVASVASSSGADTARSVRKSVAPLTSARKSIAKKPVSGWR